MKKPKWRCAYPNSHKVKFGGKFLTQWEGYHLTLQQSTGGTISADKLRGYPEQSANLSYTANTFYHFNGWNSTGANIQNSKVPFTQDTTAKANFIYDPIPTSAQTNVGGGIWMNHDLDYDDGGPGIKRIDHPVYYYNYYKTEQSDPVLLRVELPGPEYYYTLEAAHRVANKISGWHLPTNSDWNTYLGINGPFNQSYRKVISQNTRDWFPSGEKQVMGYTATTFNAMPYMDYESMRTFDISGGDYRVLTGSHPYARDLISRWWVASGKELSGVNYAIVVDGFNFIGRSYWAGNYMPVRLKKD